MRYTAQQGVGRASGHEAAWERAEVFLRAPMRRSTPPSRAIAKLMGKISDEIAQSDVIEERASVRSLLPAHA